MTSRRALDIAVVLLCAGAIRFAADWLDGGDWRAAVFSMCCAKCAALLFAARFSAQG